MGAELEAEALAQFREKQKQREKDDELPEEAKNMLMNLKNMREQAKQQGDKEVMQKYDERIEALRAEHL